MDRQKSVVQQLRVTAEIHEEFFMESQGAKGGVNANSEHWMSDRARGLMEAAEWIETLVDHFPVEIVRDMEHMEDFEFGTPFLIMSSDGQRVSVMRDIRDWWWASMWQPPAKNGRECLENIWDVVEKSNAIVIALPVPLTLPVI